MLNLRPLLIIIMIVIVMEVVVVMVVVVSTITLHGIFTVFTMCQALW